jgi:hypothetical protein
MIMLAHVLSLASGFALMRWQAPPATIIATSAAVNLALAPLTAVVASRRGRRITLWAVLGFALGMWALAAVLLMRDLTAKPPARGEPPRFPPASDAA